MLGRFRQSGGRSAICFYLPVWPTTCKYIQAEFGEFILAGLCLADAALGVGVVVVDELVKEWRLVRTKPYQMDLDDALALSDEDALARDMQALKVNRDSGRSYYMEVRHWQELPLHCFKWCCQCRGCLHHVTLQQDGRLVVHMCTLCNACSDFDLGIALDTHLLCRASTVFLVQSSQSAE